MNNPSPPDNGNGPAKLISEQYGIWGAMVEITPEGLIRKYGGRVSHTEALTMKFVAENTDIPIPKVISHRSIEISEDGDEGCEILMTLEKGETVEKAWPNLDDAQRRTIVRELSGYISQMSAIRGSFIGCVDNTPSRELRLVKRPAPRILPTVADFHDLLVDQMSVAMPSDFKAINRRALRDDYAIVFTHGDLTTRNILVHDGHISAILDWDSAGFFPEYWEYVKTLDGFKSDWKTSWPALVIELFPRRYDVEYLLFEAVYMYTYL